MNVMRLGIEKKLLQRFGRSRVTFAELQLLTQRELVIVVTEVRLGSVYTLSADTAPQADVVDAVISSMSIPVLFRPVRIRGLHPSMYFVDGGVLDNFPFHKFPNESTIGLWITELPSQVTPTLEQASGHLELIGASHDPPSLVALALSLEMSLIKRLTLKEHESFFSPHVEQHRVRNIIPLFVRGSGLDMAALQPQHAAELLRNGILMAAIHFLARDSQCVDVFVALFSLYEHLFVRVIRMFFGQLVSAMRQTCEAKPRFG
jgi:hypothetical protein